MNQTDLASLAGVSKGAQINWEKDVNSPPATALVAYAEAGADVLYILTGRRSAPSPQNEAVSSIESDLVGIRRDLIDPSRQRFPDDTEEKAEERAIQKASGLLRAMLRYDRTYLTKELEQEIEHLLAIAESPAALALYRAADSAQMRARRREMRERILGWFEPDRYTPNDTVLSTMVATVLEHGVPYRNLVDLVEEVFDDARAWHVKAE